MLLTCNHKIIACNYIVNSLNVTYIVPKSCTFMVCNYPVDSLAEALFHLHLRNLSVLLSVINLLTYCLRHCFTCN